MKQFLQKSKHNFLYINSQDREILRKGRLIQLLILLLAFVNFGFLFFGVLQMILMTPLLPTLSVVNPGFLILFLLFGVTWVMVRNGRIRRAAHLFSAGTITIFLLGFFFTPDPTIPYVALISVVAIAVLDSVRTSTIYALITAAIVSIIFALSPDFTFIDTTKYLITAVGICITIWITARDLNYSVLSTQRLNRDIYTKNSQLQRNASLLQLSAEVSQLTAQSLDLDILLENTVKLIRDRFGFFYVAIYLLDKSGKKLVLKEATGTVGEQLMKEKHTLTLDEENFVTAVVKTQQSQIGNPPSNPQNPKELAQDTKTELALPLVSRGSIKGVLDLHGRMENPFKEEDIAVFEIMANQIAVNIDNANLFSESELRFNETKILFDLNNHLTETFDTGEIYRRTAVAFATHLNASHCRLASWNIETNTLDIQADYIQDNEENRGEYLHLIDTISLDSTSKSYQTITSLTTRQESLSSLEIQKQDRDTLTELNQHHLLEIPFIHGHEALGLATLYRPKHMPPFTNSEIQFGKAIANQTATVLENAILTSNTRGQLAQFRSLLRLSSLLSQASTLEEIYRGSRREILSLIEATGIAIMLTTKSEDALQWVYGHEFGQELDLSSIGSIPFSRGLSGHVAQTKEILYIEKTPETLQKYNTFTIGNEKGYWIGLPLLVSTKLIGILAVETEDPVLDKEIALLKTIVGPLGIAINNLLQFDEIAKALEIQSRQRLQLKTAASVAASATKTQSLHELLQNSVDLIKEQFNLYYVGLFLINEEGNQAILQTGTGEAGRLQIEAKHQLPVGGQSLIGGASRDGDPRIIQDVMLNDEWHKNEYLPNTRSELALPLRVPGNILGALTVQSDTPNIFDEELVDTLQTMTDQLAVAIQNIQLLEETSARASDQQWLNDVSTKLHHSTDVTKIIEIGLNSISERFGGAPINLKLGRNNPNHKSG